LNSIENYSPVLLKSICLQTDMIEKCTKYTNTPNYLEDMLIQGQNMNDEEFEKFIKGKNEDLDPSEGRIVKQYLIFHTIIIIRLC
jgi:hypothetical protein